MATRLTIAQSERALLWRQGRFVGILEPGVRWVVQPFASIAVQLYDLRVPEFEHPRLDELLTQARRRAADEGTTLTALLLFDDEVAGRG